MVKLVLIQILSQTIPQLVVSMISFMYFVAKLCRPQYLFLKAYSGCLLQELDCAQLVPGLIRGFTTSNDGNLLVTGLQNSTAARIHGAINHLLRARADKLGRASRRTIGSHLGTRCRDGPTLVLCNGQDIHLCTVGIVAVVGIRDDGARLDGLLVFADSFKACCNDVPFSGDKKRRRDDGDWFFGGLSRCLHAREPGQSRCFNRISRCCRGCGWKNLLVPETTAISSRGGGAGVGHSLSREASGGNWSDAGTPDLQEVEQKDKENWEAKRNHFGFVLGVSVCVRVKK